MITDSRWQTDPIAAPKWANRKQGLVRNTGAAEIVSIHMGESAASRAAANIAVWRGYLPDDCVAAMIEDGWHWST